MAMHTVKSSKQEVQVPMAWKDRADLLPVFADQLHVAHVNNQFYLTFGQMRVRIGPHGDASIDGEVEPVAKLILTAEAMQKIAFLISQIPGKGIE